jgi:hypothetical protein
MRALLAGSFIFEFSSLHQLLVWNFRDFAGTWKIVPASQHVYFFGIGRRSASLDFRLTRQEH